MDISGKLESLQELLAFPRNKHEEFLAQKLNKLEPAVFEEVVNQGLPQITSSEVKQFGVEFFNQIDRYPNPPDGFVSRDEITERFVITRSSRERSILLWIWLHFEEIRVSSDDFAGEDVPFDVVLTLNDFEKMNF